MVCLLYIALKLTQDTLIFAAYNSKNWSLIKIKTGYCDGKVSDKTCYQVSYFFTEIRNERSIL